MRVCKFGFQARCKNIQCGGPLETKRRSWRHWRAALTAGQWDRLAQENFNRSCAQIPGRGIPVTQAQQGVRGHQPFHPPPPRPSPQVGATSAWFPGVPHTVYFCTVLENQICTPSRLFLRATKVNLFCVAIVFAFVMTQISQPALSPLSPRRRCASTASLASIGPMSPLRPM